MPESPSLVLEVGDESLAQKAGFACFDLYLSRADVPVDGWYGFIVTGPGGERFILPCSAVVLAKRGPKTLRGGA